MEELQKAFAIQSDTRMREGKGLPRPGTHVPIEFASRQRVNAYPESMNDFVRLVLNLDWAWISDESSLWDFHSACYKATHLVIAEELENAPKVSFR